MKNISIIFLLLFINQIFSQQLNDENLNKVYTETYGKCFKELKPVQEAKDIISLKSISFCSLYQCVAAVEYTAEDKEVQEAILKRAIEITKLLYNQGTPIYLLSGMDSSGTEVIENQNLNDDNNLIYIAVAECLTSNSLEKIKNAVNEETLNLIHKKNIH